MRHSTALTSNFSRRILKVMVAPAAIDGEHDLAARRALDARDRVVPVERACLHAVDAVDDVAGLDAGAEGGRALDGRHDHEAALALFQVDADAGDFRVAFGFLLQAVVFLGIHEARVGIQGFGQAARGSVHQLGLGDVLDVVVLDVGEHLGEDAQLVIRVEPPRASGSTGHHAAGKGTQPGQGEEQDSGAEEADDAAWAGIMTGNGSAIDFFAVANPHDRHGFRPIVDLVENAVVALPNSVLFCAAELLAAMRSRFAREQLDLGDNALTLGLGKIGDLLGRRTLDFKPIAFHVA